MTWIYKGKEVKDKDTEGQIGFVYLITNKATGKKYVGKKLLSFRRTKKYKNKRSKKVTFESDWKSYYGSSNELLKDIELLGKDNFSREIIRFCETRGSCNYYEMKHQVLWEVLESEDWYNDQIRARVHRNHLRLKKNKKTD
jgi:hypothetical protein